MVIAVTIKWSDYEALPTQGFGWELAGYCVVVFHRLLGSGLWVSSTCVRAVSNSDLTNDAVC